MGVAGYPTAAVGVRGWRDSHGRPYIAEGAGTRCSCIPATLRCPAQSPAEAPVKRTFGDQSEGGRRASPNRAREELLARGSCLCAEPPSRLDLAYRPIKVDPEAAAGSIAHRVKRACGHAVTEGQADVGIPVAMIWSLRPLRDERPKYGPRLSGERRRSGSLIFAHNAIPIISHRHPSPTTGTTGDSSEPA